MNDLIMALMIFAKYNDSHNPTNCEHDTLRVCVDPELVSEEDKKVLETLSFKEDDMSFISYRFGSC